MAHYRAHLDDPVLVETDALRFGALAHLAVLEPLQIAQQFVVMPDFTVDIRRADGTEYSNPKATTVYKDKVREFASVNAGREIVAQEWLDRVIGIAESVARNKRASDWLRAEGPVEVSLVWDDPTTGLRCKARPDKLNEDRIVDLKTTRDCGDFEQSIARFAYYRQAAFYLDGAHALTGEEREFALVAVEKEPPYAVIAAPLSFETIKVGRAEYQTLLQQIVDCESSGDWPGYPDPQTFSMPAWAYPVTTEL